MEATYKRHLNQSCMILETGCELEELYELDILSYNKIPVLLSMEMEVTDGMLRLWYDITGRQSLADYLERKKVDMKLFGQLFEALGKMCQEVQNYLLIEDNILLQAKYIYMDFEQRDIRFVYLPGLNTNIRISVQELLELILQKLDHGDQQAVSVAYEMYQRSLQEEGALFPLLEWVSKASDMGNRESDMEIEEEGTEEEEAEEFKDIVPEKKSIWKETIHKIKQQKQQLKVRKKEEELPYVIQQEEVVHPTEVLYVGEQVRGVLLYQGSEGLEDIKIDKSMFLIGKKEGEVDGYIKMKCISRIHAKIEKEEEDYYLEDMNSTNGTFLNGERLEFHQKVQLRSKDRIAFGLAEYIFI